MFAIYARQSIERQDSVSIDAQIEQCRHFTSGDTKIYTDAGYSGKNTNRPEFERMLRDIARGEITAVVSYRLDRVSRNLMDFAGLLRTFEQHGVQYISATEQFDTSTPMGRAMIYIVMVFAQLERETIATRILDNYRFRATKGLFMGGNTPFGYASHRTCVDGKQISVLEPNEQKGVLRRIFDCASSNESLYRICHDLNREGILTTKGSTWTNNALKRVLQNITPCCADEPLYHYLTACGYTITNSMDAFDGTHGMCIFFKHKNRNQPTEITDQLAVVGLHEPLISSQQYMQVQKILNAAAPSHSKRAARTFLAGLVQCAECGHSFGVKYTTSGDTAYSYFRCRGREQRGTCSNALFIQTADLENRIVQKCKQHLYQMGVSTVAVDKQNAFQPRSEVERLQVQMENLIDNIGKGNAVVDKLLTQKITLLQAQMEEITSNIRKTPAEHLDEPRILWTKDSLHPFESLDMNQKTDVIRSLVKSARIDKDGDIALEFLF